MSMKEELQTWVAALKLYDDNQYGAAYDAFETIADTSKIHFNRGIIRASLGEHHAAIACFQEAVRCDMYFAVAYYQQGVSNFMTGNFEEALVNFNDTMMYLRGNKYIDYEQLGMKYKLWSCEAVFNRGLCYIYLQQQEVGMRDIHAAAREKGTKEHDVIDDAIKDRAEGYITFSVPNGVVFRPNEAKVKNLPNRDYLGKSRLVAQAPPEGHHRRHLSQDTWAKDDRDQSQLSYAASNLVHPGLSSRSRQQSEPPLHRNLFPPTPPPETEKPLPQPQHQSHRQESPPRAGSRSQSLTRATKPKPESLDLGIAAFKVAPKPGQEAPPRYGTARSASERPSDRRPLLDRRSTEPDKYQSTRERLFGAIDNDGGQLDSAKQSDLVKQLQQHHISSSTQSYVSVRSTRSRPDLIQEEEGEDQYTPYVKSPSSTIAEVKDDSDSQSTYRRSNLRPRSRRPYGTMTKIRLKVHLNDDTRYIIINPRVTFNEMSNQISRKFLISGVLKLKTRDEDGDMITMGDQEDLEMAVAASREEANKTTADMGKMEIWIEALQTR